MIASLTHSAPLRATLLAVAALLAAPAVAHATTADPMVEGARQCTQYFPVEEQKNGIPKHLLAAISSTESGRWHNGMGLALPWPWTINVEGKGYYFNNKAEAIAQVASLQKRGVRSIDVGCMQVSLLHHPNAFANLDAAFDPATNVAYGAKFLRANYDDLHDWVKATAAYHSRTPVYGKQYLGLIEKSWNRIVSKVQEARNAQGLQPAAVDAPKFSSTPLPAAPTAGARGAVRNLTPVSASMLAKSDTARVMHPIRSTHNVNLIQVSDGTQTRRAAQTMVIRGDSASQITPPTGTGKSASVTNVALADARDTLAPSSDILVRGGDSVRQVRLDGGAATAGTTPAPASARFVFAN